MRAEGPAVGGAAATPDGAGLFGPGSVSWQVLREASVVAGGVRALLLHAAHPLVVAGARQTGMYERDPWRRLERTLRQTFTVVFGTREEALAASKRIDDVHGAIRGVDQITGQPYDARDPDLLLWVHACLVNSFLELERHTVGRLDDAGRQRFHEEQMTGVALLRLPRERIPSTVEGLRAYIDGVIAAGTLRHTPDAARVASVIRDPPPGVPLRPLWKIVAFLAFHTLPPAVQSLYGVRHTAWHEALLRAQGLMDRTNRPLLPAHLRFIAPAIVAERRHRGLPAPSVTEVGLFLARPRRGGGFLS
jgi:uncharacterized protein (DUF2236 family)